MLVDHAWRAGRGRRGRGGGTGTIRDGGACALWRPYSTSDADCDACAEAHCCTLVNACLEDTECDEGYVNCAIACAIEADAGPECLDACGAEHPVGRAEYDAAIGCVDAACATECM